LVSLSNHSDRTLSDTFRKSLREKSNKQQQIKQNILIERFEHILVDFCPQDTNLYPVLRLRSATENSPTNARDAENKKIGTLCFDYAQRPRFQPSRRNEHKKRGAKHFAPLLYTIMYMLRTTSSDQSVRPAHRCRCRRRRWCLEHRPAALHLPARHLLPLALASV